MSIKTINVIVQRVCYPAATTATDGESVWYILATDAGTCKGKMAWRPQEQEALVLEGEYTAFQGNREFSFKTARISVPTNPRDMLHYVCFRTNGIGAALEDMIWTHAGANWQNIGDCEIPRLHGRVYQNFRLQIEALTQKSEEARVIAVLMGKGATVNLASAAWSMWKGETLGVVQADPYRLAELDNHGFRDVEKGIRQAYGITDYDPRRIKAGVIYSLRRLTDAGDTVVAWEALYQQACGLLGGYSDEISDCTGALFEDGELHAFPGSEGVSLKADYAAERTIFEYVEQATKQNQEVKS